MSYKQERYFKEDPEPNQKKGHIVNHIGNDELTYIREISRNIKANDDDEAQTIMADNFIETTFENEQSYSSHSAASKVLEDLIPYSSPDVFERFTSALFPNLRLLVDDQGASFVLESCLKAATLRALTIKTEKSETEEPAAKRNKFNKVSSVIDYNLKLDIKHAHKIYCQEFVVKISNFLLNNLEEYLYENNVNHLIRSCLHCLAGSISQKNHFNKIEIISLRTQHSITTPPAWSETVDDFATRLMSWPQFPDLAFAEGPSVVLQTLCQSMKNVESIRETLKKLIKAIMRKSFKDESESEDPEEFKAFSSTSSIHLLESMMDSCDYKLLNKIYKKFFKAKLIELSQSPSLNFAVQRMIDAMSDKETFEEIFNTLTPELANILQNGNTGVVFSLCKACERLGVKQGQYIQSLLKALECAAEKSNKCIWPIIALMPLTILEDTNDPQIHLHGSLILQKIFQYNKPIKIVQSLLEMKPQDIANIFCDQKGSRIADAYLESKFIGEKSREKLIKHLEGMYLKMAMSKNGSHVLEKFYNQSSEAQKEVIVKELSERLNQLNSCVPGRILNYKFSLETYSRNPKQWKNFLARNSLKGGSR